MYAINFIPLINRSQNFINGLDIKFYSGLQSLCNQHLSTPTWAGGPFLIYLARLDNGSSLTVFMLGSQIYKSGEFKVQLLHLNNRHFKLFLKMQTS